MFGAIPKLSNEFFNKRGVKGSAGKFCPGCAAKSHREQSPGRNGRLPLRVGLSSALQREPEHA